MVLFARVNNLWWLAPVPTDPYTEIEPGEQWKNYTRAGSEYAAMLVNAEYRPPNRLVSLPHAGGDVVAVASVKETNRSGAPPAPVPIRKINFSGYGWEVCDDPNDRAGTLNVWDPANAWTDGHGFFHLRLSKEGNEWKSAAVRLLRSLGYGSYRFVVQDSSHLEPGAVFSMLTWDGVSFPHEMDIEVSKWDNQTPRTRSMWCNRTMCLRTWCALNERLSV